MPGTHARIHVSPGIYRDGDTLLAEVRIGSSRDGTQRRVTRRFALGTDLDTIRAWRYGEKETLILSGPAAVTRGTLAAEIPTYLATLPENRYTVDSRAIFAHWIASPLGALPAGAITRLQIIEQISRWIDQGAANNTCNRRLSRLRKLYHQLYGVTSPNPTDKITYLPDPKGEPRDIPIRIVRLILHALPDLGRATRGHARPTVSQTKIRLTVMAYTGIQGVTLVRIRPRDLDLAGARVYLRHRHKGKGAEGAWISLLPDAVEAFRAYAAANLFGQSWARSSMRKTWHAGIARATRAAAAYAAQTGDQTWLTDLQQLPPKCKPYDLRHSFASEMYRLTGDIGAVSELLQHADYETTKRYTKGAVSARVTAAITKAAAAFTATPELPTPGATPARPAPADTATPPARARGAMRLVRRVEA